jgi:hypothetical protein
MLKNVVNKIKKVFLLAPQVLTADALTASVDLQFMLNFAFEVIVGAPGFTGTDKMALKVLHSDDDITFVACAETDLYSYVSGNIAKELVAVSDEDKVHMIEYRGSKRYVKLELDIQGALTNVPVAVSGLCTSYELNPAV